MRNQSLLEVDHYLEKLEFALAISQTKGDKTKSDEIKDQIHRIGIKYEEPGT